MIILRQHRLISQYSHVNSCWHRLFSAGPWDDYTKKLESCAIEHDDYQMKVVKMMQKLHDNAIDYDSRRSSVINRLLRPLSTKVPKGLYLYGAVGGGKTMLLDLFYHSISIDRKQRIHFHEFMLYVHKKIHKLKKEEQQEAGKPNLAFDPIPKVAKHLAGQSWLICLDEFQVTDIADAMILKRLFSTLFGCGVIILATSNRHPDSLYKHGLQRSQFLPFIKVLKENCNVIELNSGIDYRVRSASCNYFFIKSPESDQEFENFFKLLCSKENDVVRTRTLSLQSRSFDLQRACGRIANCTFEELCNRPLGSADYLLISQVFHTIFIKDIPKFTITMKSQIRRFITLIDTLYDNKVRIVCSAQVSLKDLFEAKDFDGISEDQRILMDDLNLSAKDKSSLFSGEEELFAFDRTLSRLHEMQTEDYWKKWEQHN